MSLESRITNFVKEHPRIAAGIASVPLLCCAGTLTTEKSIPERNGVKIVTSGNLGVAWNSQEFEIQWEQDIVGCNLPVGPCGYRRVPAPVNKPPVIFPQP